MLMIVELPGTAKVHSDESALCGLIASCTPLELGKLLLKIYFM